MRLGGAGQMWPETKKNAMQGMAFCSGGSCRIRTYDLRIKSPLLYQLS